MSHAQKTGADLAEYIGARGLLESKDRGLYPPVRVVDARVTFGRLHLLVTPVDGHGTRWVEAERVTLDDGGNE